MSTRATIKITRGNDTLWIYHHCDGYPEGVGKDLKEYLSNIKGIWSEGEIATDLVKGHKCGTTRNIWTNKLTMGDDGYEITTCQHGDEEYGYHIDCRKRTITCYALSCDEFEWKECNIVEIP